MMEIIGSKKNEEQVYFANFHGPDNALDKSDQLIRRGPSRLVSWIVLALLVCVIICVAASFYVMMNFKDDIQFALLVGELTLMCVVITWVPAVVYLFLTCIFVWGTVKVYDLYVNYRLRVGDQIASSAAKEMEFWQAIDVAQIKAISNAVKFTEEGSRTENKTDYLITIKKEVPVGGEG